MDGTTRQHRLPKFALFWIGRCGSLCFSMVYAGLHLVAPNLSEATLLLEMMPLLFVSRRILISPVRKFAKLHNRLLYVRDSKVGVR